MFSDKENQLNSYLIDLISKNSSKVFRNDFEYSDLTKKEKQNIAAILFSMDDYDYCVLSENVLATKIENSLFSTLENNVLENKIELADVLRDGIVSYYEKRTSYHLDQACSDFISENYRKAGFVPLKSSNNGEIYWSQRHG